MYSQIIRRKNIVEKQFFLDKKMPMIIDCPLFFKDLLILIRFTIFLFENIVFRIKDIV